MARRKGAGKGRGMGYKNIMPRDPKIHSDSSKGRKQPQRIPNLTNKQEAKSRKEWGKRYMESPEPEIEEYIQDSFNEDKSDSEIIKGLMFIHNMDSESAKKKLKEVKENEKEQKELELAGQRLINSIGNVDITPIINKTFEELEDSFDKKIALKEINRYGIFSKDEKERILKFALEKVDQKHKKLADKLQKMRNSGIEDKDGDLQRKIMDYEELTGNSYI